MAASYFLENRGFGSPGVINGNFNLASTFELKISDEIQDKQYFERLSTTK